MTKIKKAAKFENIPTGVGVVVASPPPPQHGHCGRGRKKWELKKQHRQNIDNVSFFPFRSGDLSDINIASKMGSSELNFPVHSTLKFSKEMLHSLP